MIKQLTSLFFALCLAAPGTLMAHTAEWFDANPSAHSGQTRMSGPYHFELVIDGKNLAIYVTDHANNPIDVEVAKGSVTFLNNDNEKNVKISPTGENLLTGTGEFSATDSSRIWLSVKFPDEPAWRAKFSSQAKKGSINKPAKAIDHSTMDHSKMDHSKMTGNKMQQCEMKDCPMNAGGAKEKMQQCEMKDCPMKDSQGSINIDHSKMNHGEMKNHQMQSRQVEAGMDHSKMSH